MNSINAFFKKNSLFLILDNSCGVINIEYPEYLMKTSSMSSAYLQGDVARFECFQSHWIYGVHEYKCGIVVDRNQRNIIDPRDYRFEWNKGEQPWCRSREKQNFLTWLAIIGGIFGVLVFVILIFLCCWIVKQKKKGEAAERRGYDMASRSSMTGSRGGKKYPIHESEPLNEKRFDADTYRDDDFYPPARFVEQFVGFLNNKRQR